MVHKLLSRQILSGACFPNSIFNSFKFFMKRISVIFKSLSISILTIIQFSNEFNF